MSRVLHLLSQRPSLTGSGVTLEALVRQAAAAGWDQWVLVGVPSGDRPPEVGGLDPGRIRTLAFGEGRLDFPMPGMSDVMPYPSTRFSAMGPGRLEAYRAAWRRALEEAIAEARPDLIHAHHVWLLGAMIKDLAPATAVVTQCHATGFRQMALCPHLAGEVTAGCSRNDRFLVLHPGHAVKLARTLGVPEERIHVVGAGYREDLFHARGRGTGGERRLLYVGKYSAAKGLPSLLDAFAGLARRRPGLELHVAGSGGGPEAEALADRMRRMAPGVVLHGQLPQPALADLMRRCAVCVLPSFYEGVPLVLVEALACGCRLVSTRLPGVVDRLEPHLGDALDLVPLPRLDGVDTPVREDLPAFVDGLMVGMERILDRPPLGNPEISLPGALDPFRWGAVFRRVEAVWRDLVRG